MVGHQFWTVCSGLVAYCIHEAVALSRFSAKGTRETLVLNMIRFFLWNHNFTYVLVLGKASTNLVKVYNGNEIRVTRVIVDNTLSRLAHIMFGQASTSN